MADPVAKAIEELNRTVKDQNHILSEILKALAPKKPVEIHTIFESAPEKPQLYGWSMAALAQREGTLRKGDMKREEDESRWIWTGEFWERMEDPSARPAD